MNIQVVVKNFAIFLSLSLIWYISLVFTFLGPIFDGILRGNNTPSLIPLALLVNLTWGMFFLSWIWEVFSGGFLADDLFFLGLSVIFSIFTTIGVVFIVILYNKLVSEEKRSNFPRWTLLYLCISGPVSALIMPFIGTFRLSGYPERYFTQFNITILFGSGIAGILFICFFLLSRYLILKK
ncbi:MAG: hypothetical protein ACFFDC_11475 [Promethearchaeota archaeon]